MREHTTSDGWVKGFRARTSSASFDLPVPGAGHAACAASELLREVPKAGVRKENRRSVVRRLGLCIYGGSLQPLVIREKGLTVMLNGHKLIRVSHSSESGLGYTSEKEVRDGLTTNPAPHIRNPWDNLGEKSPGH